MVTKSKGGERRVVLAMLGRRAAVTPGCPSQTCFHTFFSATGLYTR